jgi:hypothetical protein
LDADGRAIDNEIAVVDSADLPELRRSLTSVEDQV